jgi:hypothetical protein
MAESPSSRAFPSSLWAGIYTFPFQLHNVKVWMILTMCGMMLAFIASGFAGMTALFDQIPPGKELMGPAMMIYRGSMYIYGSLAFLTLVSSLAPSAFFVIIIEDTAAGNEEVDWPDNVWYEYLSKVAFLGWLFGCCAAVATVFWALAAIVLPTERVVWWALTLTSAFMLFPIPLYSAMIAGSPWILIHPVLLLRLFQKPFATLALYIHTWLLVIPCVVLGLFLVVSLNWWLAPIVGVIWATCLLCYARALGRVGYFLAEDRKRVVKKKKRKKHRIRREAAD